MLFQGNVAKGCTVSGEVLQVAQSRKDRFSYHICGRDRRSQQNGWIFENDRPRLNIVVRRAVSVLRESRPHSRRVTDSFFGCSKGSDVLTMWHKSLDVRCSVRVYFLDKPNESKEPELEVTKLGKLDRHGKFY